ncbi:MAG TPA: DUF3857 domain-containing protein, partial [Blastocatellia bacterium]|nr:DUF3857 domain-containing protein [Blastocatellia bacterium]
SDSYGGSQTVLTHYLRIKIFTERGKEQKSTIDLPYFGRTNISGIQGRTIKPNGEILELKKDAVFERTIVKFGKLKLKTKSFAMPGVEPGVIIEYRYRESRPTYFHTRLEFQQDIPVQIVKYYVKPLASSTYRLWSRPFHCNPTPLVKERDFHMTSLSNVPAFKEEPYMVPENQVRAWMLLFYSTESKIDADKYWKELGKKEFNDNKAGMKVNDDVRKAATEIIGDAATTDQKLERLLRYCQTKVKRLYDDASALTDEDRKRFKENKSPADTLKNGIGTDQDIDLLFAALTSAAGLEARVVMVSDRSEDFFDPSFANDYFLDDRIIAVKSDAGWKYFAPSSTYVPYGLLPWKYEGLKGLLTDGKEPTFVDLPVSAPEKSLERTIGKFKLDETGTLEGDAYIEFTGHLAAFMKEENDDESPDKRETMLKDVIKKHLGAVEVSQIKIENVTDPVKPFIYSFHIKVENYATRTGKRLFLQPAFFQFGEAAFFTNAQRKYPVYFEYPYVEASHVEIALPEGFTLDNAEAPSSFNANDVVKYDVSLKAATDGKLLIYDRTLKLNGMVFPVETYSALKQVFDLLHKQDNHQVTLKFTAAAASK